MDTLENQVTKKSLESLLIQQELPLEHQNSRNQSCMHPESQQQHPKKQRTCASRYRKDGYQYEPLSEMDQDSEQRRTKLKKNKRISRTRLKKNIDDENDSTTKQKMLYSHQSNGKEKKFLKGRRCFNKECGSRQIYKKLASRLLAEKYRYLCEVCYHSYDSNNFCEFCEQIYFTDVSCYSNQWVECQTCSRRVIIPVIKVHTQCRKDRESETTPQERYECINCRSKRLSSKRMKRNKRRTEYLQKQSQEHKRQDIEVNSLKGNFMFDNNINNFPIAEMFLNRHSNRFLYQDMSLSLTLDQIKNDIDNLKTLLN